jgi:beta-glucosidase
MSSMKTAFLTVTAVAMAGHLAGLFENPYVDASKAGGIVGRDEFRAKALDAQRKSIVLL